MTCPKCGWSDVRVSERARVLDYLLTVVALTPLRCRKCRLRYYRPWFLLSGPVKKPEPQPMVFRNLLVPAAIEPPPQCVLLVDPDIAVRVLLAKLLCREGYAVLHAADVSGAVAELTANHIDAVIANLNDDEQDEAIRDWRSAYPEMSIVTLSNLVPQSEAEGNVLMLPRPSRPSAMVRGVQQMLKAC